MMIYPASRTSHAQSNQLRAPPAVHLLDIYQVAVQGGGERYLAVDLLMFSVMGPIGVLCPGAASGDWQYVLRSWSLCLLRLLFDRPGCIANKGKSYIRKYRYDCLRSNSALNVEKFFPFSVNLINLDYLIAFVVCIEAN